jgi:hypothetical protein
MASLAQVALGLATALSWLGLGTLLLTRLRDRGELLLDAINRIGAGAVAWSLLTAGAGWLGLLYRPIYLVAFVPCAVGGAAAAVPLVRALPRPRPAAWPWWQRALGLLIATYVVLDLVSTLAPISSRDALFYHAAGPALFAHRHELVELPWSWQSYQPFSVEMLVLDGFLLWNPIQGALAPLLLAFGAAAVVAGAAYRLRGRATALLATAIFIGEPFMLWLSSSTFVEPGLALVIGLGAWNVWRLQTTGLARFAVLAGIFAGAAAGMKYDGLAAGAAVAAAGAVLARRRLSPATIAAFVVPATLVPLAWYAKNAIVTGNPFYPLLFGGANPEADAALHGVLRGYGHGHSVVDALLLPFRFVTSGRSFDRGDFVSPLFLALAPAALLARPARRVVLVVFAVSICYVAAWFVSSQQARYLVPLLSAFAIVAAIGASALAAQSAIARRVVSLFIAGALAAALAISLVYTSQFVPYVFGRQSAAQFLSHKSSYYDGVAWLDVHVPRGVVLTDFPDTLYLRQPYVVATEDVLPRTTTGTAVLQFTRKWRISAIALVQSDTPLIAQLRPALGPVIARVPVHSVTSRTLNRLGPADTMLVYRAQTG